MYNGRKEQLLSRSAVARAVERADEKRKVAKRERAAREKERRARIKAKRIGASDEQ